MNIDGLVLLGILLSSFLTGVAIFFLNEESHRLRTWLNLLGAGLKLILVAALLWGIYQGHEYSFSIDFLPGIPLALGADAHSVLFVTLSTVLWFWTTLYAVGYLEGSPHRSRFFGFFSLCVTATTGIALSANLVTFLTFYELLTVTTYPLVVHRGTEDAMRGGRIYLAYTMLGGTVLLLAVVWLHGLAGPIAFRERGAIESLMATRRGELQALFMLFMIGIGFKAALVPLHGWLPKAMVAPAPVSALLHAVAVVKAGAFGIVRIVHDVFGIENAAKLGVLQPLAIAAGVTILYGSLLALFQDGLKKRLAYSTVSQVSYIVLGTAILGPLATIGGLVHLVHQGLMKITLFFGAGNYAETLGIHRVSEMNGVGRRMPWTTAAFTVAALGMIGLPPLAGHVSKSYLNQGAAAAGQEWVAILLAASSLLNAAYFLPILWRAWFMSPPRQWPHEHAFGRWETHWMLLAAPLVTAGLVLWAGLSAESSFSPLAWVKLIAAREYGP
ncbi:MAG TPA: proton-conducting transporter membrane subunit [Candidatus Paceibacterota bacterium]|nr:monovalent cation/H+ antiporter subunit D family protein [Verrucomicrobiota bacterium]HOX01996.1 proton-conducting transporter membrane subunit [Verrucomicrobiota bacterium]HRZ44851.1 proton-conducting transporter membrane subunit [Candidatus Paceibacterota bacterium]HRZ94687.1 proton-conducting transporter membrane subunit [Candidatus Paceibacterota bacterium]